MKGQVGALSTVEAKKRFEFLDAVGSAMDAHLRYFKQVLLWLEALSKWRYAYNAHAESKKWCHVQGYELLHQMEPYINQVQFFFFYYGLISDNVF